MGKILYIGYVCFVTIVMFLLLPFLSFLLYRNLRKKGTLARVLSLMLFLVITLTQIAFILADIFKDETDANQNVVVIEQSIGGELNCSAECFDVGHSFYWDVSYDFVMPEGDTIHFQKGSFYGRKWDKKTQLKTYEDFIFLVSGIGYYSCRLQAYNFKTDSLKVFGLNQSYIENNPMWIDANIDSRDMDFMTEVKIIDIIDDEIIIKYKFESMLLWFSYNNKRFIKYKFDTDSFDLNMVAISKNKRFN
jgi:hypothetical protein